MILLRLLNSKKPSDDFEFIIYLSSYLYPLKAELFWVVKSCFEKKQCKKKLINDSGTLNSDFRRFSVFFDNIAAIFDDIAVISDNISTIFDNFAAIFDDFTAISYDFASILDDCAVIFNEFAKFFYNIVVIS